MSVSVVTWQGEDVDEPRWEQAAVTLELGRLQARGTALTGGDAPFRVDYELATEDDYVTHRLVVRAEGAGWRRELWLRRDGEGRWSARRMAEPAEEVDPLADPSALDGALDCDLALSPLTNLMPVLRHDLHRRPGRHDLVMAWVSVPDLVVHVSRQRYEHVRDGVVRYSSLDQGFTADLRVDGEGLVVSYPGIGVRV